jgi:hypothetical protein
LKNIRHTKIIAGTETTLSKLQNNEDGYIPSLVKFNSASVGGRVGGFQRGCEWQA